MSYQAYTIIHLIGIFLVIASLGGITLHVINGGTRTYAARKWAGMFHGIGLLVTLVGGFGLMARLGVPHTAWPTWIWVKFAVWLVLGALPALIYRNAKLAKLFWLLIFVFAGTSAYMAIYKPVLG